MAKSVVPFLRPTCTSLSAPVMSSWLSLSEPEKYVPGTMWFSKSSAFHDIQIQLTRSGSRSIAISIISIARFEKRTSESGLVCFHFLEVSREESEGVLGWGKDGYSVFCNIHKNVINEYRHLQFHKNSLI